MKEIYLGLKRIFREEKGLLGVMLLLFVLGMSLGIYTLLNFKGGGTTMYIGYSDIGTFDGADWLSLWNSGGYRTGGWMEMAIFPIIGVSTAILHNLLAIQVFQRRGKGYAQLVVMLSIIMVVGSFIVLLRLLNKI